MPKSNCDCHDDASQHTSHTIRTMARSASTVVAGRVTNATAKTLLGYCKTHNCTQSEALRKALVVLSANGDDPEKQLAAVAAALGLEPDATGDEVQQAIAALIAGLPPDAADGANEFPDPVPPAPGTASLSPATLAACKRHGVRPQDYLAELASARARTARSKPTESRAEPVRQQLSKAEREGIKRLGITEAEYRARKANAVRRV